MTRFLEINSVDQKEHILDVSSWCSEPFVPMLGIELGQRIDASIKGYNEIHMSEYQYESLEKEMDNITFAGETCFNGVLVKVI